MKIEKARQIIGEKYFEKDGVSFTKNNWNWSDYRNGDDIITLDGIYSIEELEAFIAIIRHLQFAGEGK